MWMEKMGQVLADTIHHGLHRPPDGMILAEEAAAEAVVRMLQQHPVAGHQGRDAHPDHLDVGQNGRPRGPQMLV